jgi:hypothetical protein
MAKHSDPYRTPDVFPGDAELSNGKYYRTVLERESVSAEFAGQLPGMGI